MPSYPCSDDDHLKADQVMASSENRGGKRKKSLKLSIDELEDGISPQKGFWALYLFWILKGMI